MTIQTKRLLPPETNHPVRLTEWFFRMRASGTGVEIGNDLMAAVDFDFMDHLPVEVNPWAPRHKCRGLLGIDPERRFLSPPSKAGLCAVERVKNTSSFMVYCHTNSRERVWGGNCILEQKSLYFLSLPRRSHY
jgi:hypothetical protein